jgi:hypothetical protein
MNRTMKALAFQERAKRQKSLRRDKPSAQARAKNAPSGLGRSLSRQSRLARTSKGCSELLSHYFKEFCLTKHPKGGDLLDRDALRDWLKMLLKQRTLMKMKPRHSGAAVGAKPMT